MVVHVGGPFPLCGAVVVVDVIGASQVVHLLLPAWRQRRQQLLRPLGTGVGGLVPALRFLHKTRQRNEKNVAFVLMIPHADSLSYLCKRMVKAKCQEADSDIFSSGLLHWHERPDSNTISIKCFTFLLRCMRFKYRKWLFNVPTWNRVSPTFWQSVAS